MDEIEEKKRKERLLQIVKESQEKEKARDELNDRLPELFRKEEEKSLTLFGNTETDNIIKELDMRQYNTIPKKVKLTITFKDNHYTLGEYEYTGTGGQTRKRKGGVIKAIIKYEKEASDLIMNLPFPLILSKNAIIGISNHIRANGYNFDLNERTFTVINKNNHTYMWEEVKSIF